MGRTPFQRRVVELTPGSSRPYDQSEWEDALVIVTQGEIELEGLSGRRWHFPEGAILWLTDLPLSALHNPGRQPAQLTTVSRPISSRTPIRPTSHDR